MAVEDPRIDELIAVIAAYSVRLASRLAELAVAQDVALRVAMRSEIQDILVQMRQEIQNWISTVFGEMLQEMDEDLLADIPAELLETGEIPIQESVTELRSVLDLFERDINTAIGSIEAMVSRLVRGDASQVLREDSSKLTAALAAGAAGAAVVASIRARAIDRLQDNLLSLLGANGRIYQYDLSYYMALSAQTMKGRAQKELVLRRAWTLGADLVQVSANPSTIGDYCDLYRGKVFSISGTHAIFPPLAHAPAKGTPFHPWCRHKMSIFDDTRLTEDQQRKLADIPKEFLDLAEKGAGPNEFQKAWVKRKKAKA
jgi:hypothetical protein